MAKKKEPPGLIEQLKDAIRASGRSLYALGKESGVDAPRLSRFMNGQRGLSLDALEKIFKTLRLEIVLSSERPSRPRRAKPEPEQKAPPTPSHASRKEEE